MIYIIFLTALAPRLLYLFAGYHSLGLDSEFYNTVALSIVNGTGFSCGGAPTAYVVPFYPMFLAFIYKISGFSNFYVYLAQLIIGAVNCVLVYMIAKKLFDNYTALVSAAVSSLYFFFIKCENMLMTEAIFMPLVTVSILLAIKTQETKRILYISLFALSVSLATLTRSAFFLFPFVIVVLDIIFNLNIFGNRLNLIKVRNIVIFIVIFSMPIGFWAYRNYRVFNSFIPLATEAGHALYFSYHPKDGKIFGIAEPDATSKKIFKNDSEVTQSRLFTQAAIRDIKKDPLKALKLIGLKNAYFWSLFDWEILGLKGIYNFSTAFILPFFIAGAFWIIVSRRTKAMIFLIMPILYTYSLSMAFMGLPRNRYTIEQFMIIIASFSMVKLFSAARLKRLYVLGVFLWLELNLCLFLNSGIVKEYAKSLLKNFNLW